MPGYVLAAASRIAVHVMASAARSLAASRLKMFMSESGSMTVPSALKWPVVSGGMGRSTSPSVAKTAGMSGISSVCGLLVLWMSQQSKVGRHQASASSLLSLHTVLMLALSASCWGALLHAVPGVGTAYFQIYRARCDEDVNGNSLPHALPMSQSRTWLG